MGKKWLAVVALGAFNITAANALTGNDLFGMHERFKPERATPVLYYVLGMAEVELHYSTLFAASKPKELPNSAPTIDKIRRLQWLVENPEPFCMPADAKPSQAYDIVIQYLDSEPGQRHKSASTIVRAALRNAWPCQ